MGKLIREEIGNAGAPARVATAVSAVECRRDACTYHLRATLRLELIRR